MPLDDLGHAAVQVGGRQRQVGLGLRAVALHGGTGVAGDLEHGGVFAECVDEQQAHTFVAGVHDGTVKQPRAKTPAACLLQHRHTKLGAALVFSVLRERQVRHGDQLQAAVVDAKNLVGVEVEFVDITLDLLVAGGVAKTQVAVRRLQRHQVVGDTLAVRRAQGTDRNHHRGSLHFFTLGEVRHRTQQGPSRVDRGL